MLSRNENSDCGCNSESPLVQENMSCDDKKKHQEEMLENIKSLNFSVVELALYLDTHPEDQRALCMHRKYTNDLKDLKDKYQRVYGPLDFYFPCNKWRWIEEPWPWEGGKC